MRNQERYNVKTRDLNIDEQVILKYIEKESGMKLHIVAVAYERHIPRATLCRVYQSKWFGLLVVPLYGISVRIKTDIEDPEIGRLKSFRRALEEYVERTKKTRQCL